MGELRELIEQLRKGTAGLTLFEIEALWGEAATALSAVVERRKTTGDRFFIDHGQIHDRATGKHVTTDEDSVFCDGINSALELLNTLNAGATEAADAITTLRAENAAATDLVNEYSMAIIRMQGERDTLRDENERLRSEISQLRQPEWFYNADDGEYTYGDVSDTVDDMSHEGVMRVGGAREVWKKWVAVKCVALDVAGDVDETEVLTFDTEAEALRCWPESHAACLAALKERMKP